MPFPRRLLTEDEEVVVELRPHWLFLGWPLVVALAVVALSVAVAVMFSHAPVGVLYVLLVLVAASALWLAARLVRWFATNLVVTTTRIVQRSGVLARSGFELRLERVNQLSFHQSLFDRALRTGELLVEMGGETGTVVFEHVPRPAAVQSVITEQINAVHRGTGAAGQGSGASAGAGADAAGTRPRGAVGAARNGSALTGDTPPSGTARVSRSGNEPSVADRLVQLDELHRRGIITDDEFAAKKAELLDRL
jgi:membrane protein YdbS with pleckstrin-like domain